MGSSPVAQVPTTSIDQQGASVVTATRSATNSRLGSIYDNDVLAAGSPVHFHPLGPGRFLALFSRRWSAATPSATRAGYYASYTESLAPSWFVSGATGARSLVSSTPDIPVHTLASSVVLRDATSRGQDYLFLLHTATIGGVGTGLVQHFRVSATGRVVPVNEEVIPNLASPAVTFDKGIYLTPTNLMVVGSDPSNNLYLARKTWSQVGVSAVSSAKSGLTQDASWKYYTGGSVWSPSASDMAPLAGITSAGPVSYASNRGTEFLSTVQANGTTRTAEVYTRKPGGSWKLTGAAVPLGSTSDGSYLGGTLHLQPTLAATQSLITSPASETAIPYLTSVKNRNTSEDTLGVVWDVLQVPRQS